MTSHVVIGGFGFIGRHLVRALAESGENVSVVDMRSFPKGSPSVNWRLFDMSRASSSDFDAMLGTAEIVHHYAWTTIPTVANADPLADLQSNLRLTIGLLEAVKRRGGGRIVFSSSGGTVYGPLRKIPVPEDHRLEPITAYGVSKVAAEKYMQFYRHIYGVDARVVRISNPYGAGQNPARQQGVVTTFVHRALDREVIEIWGDGEIVRDFIYIGDVVPALIAAASYACDSASQMPVFNVGSGRPNSLNDIVRFVEEVLGAPITVEYKPGRAFDVPVNVLDITKAMRELRWRPQLELRTGITKMIEDLRDDRGREFAS
jgi:UDP-glucose 4-epimerase